MPPRTRENLELISDVTARKITFRKRKLNVYKKADELSKLCDIDVCLIVYEADKKKGRPIQPELWPEDRREFNRILNKYKAYEDVPSAGLKRNFELSDFYEVKEKQAVETKEKQDVEPKRHTLFHKRMEKYSTWDDRIDKFSQDELGKLLQSLEAKIQASTKKIGNMERNKRFAGKQKLAVDEEEASTSKAPRKVSAHDQTCDDELGSLNMEWTKSTSSALQLMPPTYVQTPMLPSAWISRSQSEKVQ